MQAAANAVRRADRILVCAGAGFGVDSGLPDFRGSQGFWEVGVSRAKVAQGATRPAETDGDPSGVPVCQIATNGIYGSGESKTFPYCPLSCMGLLRSSAATLSSYHSSSRL